MFGYTFCLKGVCLCVYIYDNEYTSIEILAILRHYFKLVLKATLATQRIWKVEGNETISGHTAQNMRHIATYPKDFKQSKINQNKINKPTFS